MTPGQIVNLDYECNAFDDSGVHYALGPGDSALVLESNDYDVTLLCCGAVLYVSTGSFSMEGLLS